MNLAAATDKTIYVLKNPGRVFNSWKGFDVQPDASTSAQLRSRVSNGSIFDDRPASTRSATSVETHTERTRDIPAATPYTRPAAPAHTSDYVETQKTLGRRTYDMADHAPAKSGGGSGSNVLGWGIGILLGALGIVIVWNLLFGSRVIVVGGSPTTSVPAIYTAPPVYAPLPGAATCKPVIERFDNGVTMYRIPDGC